MTWLTLAAIYIGILWFAVGLCAMGQAEDRAEMALALWYQFAPRRVLGNQGSAAQRAWSRDRVLDALRRKG